MSAKVDDVTGGTAAEELPSDPSVVELCAGQLPQALGQVREILARCAEADLELMVFGRSIVRPFIVERRGFGGEIVEALELNRVSVRALSSYLDSVAQFMRWSKPRKDTGKPQKIVCDCPPSLAQLFLETPEGWSRMPRVNRICETPLLRDGRLITKRGYNAETGAWMHAPPNVRLHAPLTEEIAQASLARVREWLAEFPFGDRAQASDHELTSLDESVAVCALLTAALRASLPAAPGFLIDKPSYGAGATTLAKLVHIILTGRLPAVMNVQNTEEEELRKQLDAAQLAGRACIVLDNVRDGATLTSTALAQLISESTRLVRLLGQSKDDEVACSQMVLVTGINCTVANDLVRRFLRCRLAATQERAQERIFMRPNLLEEAQQRRAELLSDLFTITAAYLASGKRAHVIALAGFRDWSRLCAEPLVWLRLRDPIPSSHSLEAEDPVTTMLREVVAHWHTAFGTHAITVRELIEGGRAIDPMPVKLSAERLREIFAEICPARDGKPDPRRVGTWLRRIRGRLVGKQSIHRGEDSEHEKVGTWVLRSLP
jgi:putative DNA primase/helicase